MERTAGLAEETRPDAALGVIALAAFFLTMDVTIVNVALPSIGGEFRASTSALQWVMDAYNIALAGLLLLGGSLGDRIGRKGAFLAGLALFAAGSLAAGVSDSLGLLVGSRAVMGAGAAFLLTSALSLIGELFPPERRGHALGVWAGIGALGMAVGPVAGGVLASLVSWHWIFRVNVPVMAAVFFAGLRMLPEGGGDVRGRMDLAGSFLSITGLTAILWALIEGPERGWTSPATPGALTAGILLLGAFVHRELRCLHPMFRIRALRDRSVLGASLSLFATYVFFTGMLFLVPQHLEAVEGVGTLVSGLSLLPFSGVVWFFSVKTEPLTRRLGAVRVLTCGLAVMTASLGLLAVVSPVGSLALIVAGACLGGAGLGVMIPAASVVIIDALPVELTGTASATSMLSRFLGASFGVALAGTILSVGFRDSLAREAEGSWLSSRFGEVRSVQQALADAGSLPAGAATVFMKEVRGSFEHASSVTFAVLAVLTGLFSAAVAMLFGKRGAPSGGAGPRAPDPGMAG